MIKFGKKSMENHWQAIEAAYRQDETECVQALLATSLYTSEQRERIQAFAKQLIEIVRQKRLSQGGLDAFLSQYDLSSEEGIALMCLAEALLRIPDPDTIDQLIRDKLSKGNWELHLGKSHSLFVNAATWGLMLTGKLLDSDNTRHAISAQWLTQGLRRLASKGGEPIVRQAVGSAMKILGRQFVMGRTITSALKRARKKRAMGYRFSFDMLGEAAYTAQDAEKYFDAYQRAIEAIAHDNQGEGPIVGSGVSVKLSALHPRFTFTQWERLESELYPRLCVLVEQAKAANINLTIDAEEAHMLTTTLRLLEKIIQSGMLDNWHGMGLAVQAYQKRAPYVIEWLIDRLRMHRIRMMVRLVKGAYWDTEIKLAQVQGLAGYPVYTRKVTTDVNYIVCAKQMLQASDVLYSQFATHNAMTLATVNELAKTYQVSDYEFQCLHGMGAPLYDEVIATHPCRIYAPVGTHEELLAYLVRRLLENGANTSFVNRIINEKWSIADLVVDPVQRLCDLSQKPHPHIPLPRDLFLPTRMNSCGVDFSDPTQWEFIVQGMERYLTWGREWRALENTGIEREQRSPIDPNIALGTIVEANEKEGEWMLRRAHEAFVAWEATPVEARAAMLEALANCLEQHQDELMALLVYEAGKTVDDAVAEIREAVDFCRYYAVEARRLFAQPTILPGPTGERNEMMLRGMGVVLCISPWNFPLAIFLGQVAASIVAGNTVIAKPASQTVFISARVIAWLHEVGVPPGVVQLLVGKGSVVMDPLVRDPRVMGVVFTGSTETAQHIQQQLATRKGAIARLIAETGGQNAMIVDSSALPEQVTSDVMTSAFRSAGQRCSALRVLFLPEVTADKIIAMIKGAMAEWHIGDPSQLSTDMGPVIDEAAKAQLNHHVDKMKRTAKWICAAPLVCERGSYVSAHLIEIASLACLEREVFGPILHVIRYKSDALDDVIRQINETGYGLTLGVHSRITETVEKIKACVRVGNIYVNRNMIGAVVGVQPFGGEGLSGTGPKAGGSHYLPRLAVERVCSVNTTASGGNASLMSLQEE